MDEEIASKKMSLPSKVLLSQKERVRRFKVKKSSTKNLVQAFYDLATENKNKIELLLKSKPFLTFR